MSNFTVVKLLDDLNIVNIPSGLVPKGAYDNATDYAVGDSVDYLGSSYVMFVDATAGTLPTDITKWQVLANKGDQGVPGVVGGTLEDLGGATKALDNLASVAINTSLISDTDSTDDLGSTTKQWANVHTDRLVSTISNLVIENDLSDGDITFKVNDGGVDTTVMTLDGATGNVGIGTTSPSNRLHVEGTLGDNVGNIPLLFVRNTPSTNIPASSMIGLAKTSGNMADGFGSRYLFSIQDDTYGSSANYIAGFGAVRNGADNSGALVFQTYNTGVVGEGMRIDKSGNVGIGTTAPTNLLSLGGNSARTFWLERHTTSNTAGNTLTITAGGATSGATDKAGGNLILKGGLSTGTGESGVILQGCVAGASGTTDRTQTTMIQVLGNKIGFFTATPVTQQTELTDELTTITHTAPSTPDYAIQDLIDSSAGATFGFATKDEGNSVLAVIANLQARVNELETKLVAYGLLVDAD